MKFVHCEISEIGLTGRYSDIYELLTKFVDSGLKCARVENFKHKTATSCAESIRASIKRYRFFQCKAMQRGDKVYLI